jgi:hypothetical protein
MRNICEAHSASRDLSRTVTPVLINHLKDSACIHTSFVALLSRPLAAG